VRGLFVLVVLLVGCSSTGSIHNADLVRRKDEMIQQDLKMKRQMQNARKRATPKSKRHKIKRARQLYI
jgi:hypothetical protein